MTIRSEIVQRLQNQDTERVFREIAGASDIKRLFKGQLNAPSAIVFPVRQSTKGNDLLGGAVSQEVTITFGVVISSDAGRDHLGADGADINEALREKVQLWLLGWQPDTDCSPFQYAGGAMLTQNRNALVWQEKLPNKKNDQESIVMAKLERKTLITAVIESTYGVDPGSGYGAILVNAGGAISLKGEKLERDTLRDTLSPQGAVIGAKQTNLQLPVEMKGGGIDSGLVAPETDLLLRACAMEQSAGLVLEVDNTSGSFQVGETLSNTTAVNTVGEIIDVVAGAGNTATIYLRSVQNTPADDAALSGGTSSVTADTVGTPVDSLVYRPISDLTAMESITVHYNMDGIRHVATGVRGTAKFNFQSGKYGTAEFTLNGTYTDPTDTAQGAASFHNTIPQACVNLGLQIGTVDMSTLTVGGMEVSLNNQVGPISSINAAEGLAGFRVTDRNPAGSIDPEVTPLSDFNPWDAWKNATSSRIYAQVGSTAGNRIRVLISNAQYTEVGYQERSGSAAYQLPFTCKGGSGDDEFFLIYS